MRWTVLTKEIRMKRTDESLLRWVVWHAGNRSSVRKLRWCHVKALFGLGRTSAYALCARFDVDPDEVAGLSVDVPCEACEGSGFVGDAGELADEHLRAHKWKAVAESWRIAYQHTGNLDHDKALPAIKYAMRLEKEIEDDRTDDA